MVWPIRSKAHSIITATVAALRPFNGEPFSGFPRNWPRWSTDKLAKVNDTQLGLPPSLKVFKFLLDLDTQSPVDDSVAFHNQVFRSDASIHSQGLAKALASFKVKNVSKTDGGLDLFDVMKQRFMDFKKHKFLEKLEHFQTLAEVQSPKLMVIACVDSRVCPSNILGFQLGEAFMVRNVANLVPPLENGPTETNAALEFAVNTLEVENIFVIGHSNCAGIQMLMSMQDDENSSFVERWVANAKIAKLRTKADATGLSFDQQCKHCEKESINCSLQNLLTYPWIEDRVGKGLLSVHGGYYDFLDCTFEKWTLDFNESSIGKGDRFSVKDKTFWC